MSICDICGKELSGSALRRHVMTVHTGEVLKKCKICKKGFANISNYHYHMAHHSDERNFLCSECPKAYKTKVDLLQHERVHDNLKGCFKCDKCSKQLNTKEKYVIHMKSHLPKGPQSCEICKKTVLNLKMHIRTVHENVRTFSCPHCEKTFAKKSGIDRHVTTVHKKQKNFICSVCNKAFGEKAQLTRHIPTHANPANNIEEPEKKFKCSECPRSFAKKDWRKRHEDTVHKRLRNFHCDLCHRAYPLKYMLHKHIRASHLKIKAKRKKKITDSTIIENFMQSGLKSIIFSESSDSDEDVTEAVYLKAAPEATEVDDIIPVNDEVDTFHSLLEAATVDFGSEFIASQAISDDISSIVVIKQEVIDALVDDFDLNSETDVFDNISAPGSPGFDNYSNPGSPVTESIVTEPTVAEPMIVKPVVITCAPAHMKKSNLQISQVHKSLNQKSWSKLKRVSQKAVTYSDVQLVTRSRSKTTKKESQPIVKFLCEAPNCGKFYNSKNDLDRHFNACHPVTSTEVSEHIIVYPNVQLYLSKDGSVSKSKAIISKDKSKEIETTKEFVCEAPNCGKSYNFRNERDQHFHGCHPELSNPEERGKRTCSDCKKFFSKIQHLKAHIAAEHNNFVFDCPHCPRTYKIKNSLKKHIGRMHEYHCPNCSKIFDTQDKIQTHWESDHKDIPFPYLRPGEVSCDICNKIFISEVTLTRHKRVVHENVRKTAPKKLSCDICKEPILGHYQKGKHMKEVHKNGELSKRKCLLCKSEFDLYHDFKTHVETHKDVVICMTCGDHFPDCDALSTHTYMTHKQFKYSTLESKLLSCDLCGHHVAHKVQIAYHMKKHTKEENFYICDICGKSYKFLAAFAHHKQSHNQIFKFSCDQCGKKYRRKPQYLVHRRSHTGERPFKCEICEKGFPSRLGLKTHQIVHSQERKTFECKMCNLKFENNVQRKNHIEQYHPELRTLFCKFCHRLFRYPHSLKVHIQSRHPDDDPNDAPLPPDRLLAPQFNHNN